ncbi:MAG: CocE/NonD family hydrolase C-terminal non-catalytic domain-containing protein, partial [Trebonia sp.]
PAPRDEQTVHTTGSPLAGSDAGAWCPYGTIVDLPTDQRAEDGRALSFTTEPLADRLEILGSPTALLRVTADRPLALVAVRLCDVAPDGHSLLVSRGLLNLCHRNGHASPTLMPVDDPTTVTVPLAFAGHAFAPGHRIRLSVSPSYWPFAWPSPQPVTLGLILGADTRLELPVRPPDDADAPSSPFTKPELTAPPASHVDDDHWRKLGRDIATGEITLEVGGSERTTLIHTGLEFGKSVSTRFSLREADPLSASVHHRGTHFLQREHWRVAIHVQTTLSATATTFLITSEINAYEGNIRVHSRHSSIELPRDHV